MEPIIQYETGATFVRKCSKCNRFVKADESIVTNRWTGGLKKQPNATCKKCGRVEMVFLGFI